MQTFRHARSPSEVLQLLGEVPPGARAGGSSADRELRAESFAGLSGRYCSRLRPSLRARPAARAASSGPLLCCSARRRGVAVLELRGSVSV